MTAPRLTSDFWVQAYLARLRLSNIPVFLVARGDATAGAVMVKLNTLDGRARLHGRAMGPDWTPIWSVLADGPEADVDAAVARQRRSDPDLWLIEVEDREGRTLLDQPGLS
jgi:hypothetical protein